MLKEDDKLTMLRADHADLNVRMQLSEVFAEGFTQWLGYFSKDKTIIAKAFAHMFILDQFYVAIVNDKVAGMTACTDGKTLSVRLNKKELRRHLGFFRGSMAGIFLKKEFEVLYENIPFYTGSIEFVGTASEFRGQGVAFQLIQYVIENTPYNNYVIEEVADTNTSALKLYKKLGFEEYKRRTYSARKAEKIGINHLVSLKYEKK